MSTGKTTYLINKVNDELVAGIKPYEIAYTSFTRSAAYEARDRAIAKFTDYSRDDFPYFSTVHSICYRLIGLKKEQVFSGQQVRNFCKYYGYELSQPNSIPDESSETDVPEMVLQTDADYYEHFIGWQRNTMLGFETAYNKFVQQPGIPDTFSMEGSKLYTARRNDYKEENGLFDFTDMIDVCAREHLAPDGIHVMINDEHQDVSPLLAKLLDVWQENVQRVYRAGDPYQAVYTFMGADPSIFIDSPSDETVVLKQSYRCPKAVHDLSRTIVQRFNVRYKNDDFIPNDTKGYVFRNIADGIDWKDLTGKTFYLHRTHWLLSQAYNILIRDGVPFSTMRGKQSPMQSSTAKVISMIYRLSRFETLTISEIGKLMENMPTKTSRHIFLRVGAKTECKQLIRKDSKHPVTVRDLPSLGFTTDFMTFLGGNLLEPLKMDADEKSYFRTVIERHGIKALEKEPDVVLSTIHGVKGKECDNVILNLQLTRRTYQAYLDDHNQEERLFYVGITRSKKTVTLLEPKDSVAFDL